eukprot:2589451-Pyramimonas_sp.AAC.1
MSASVGMLEKSQQGRQLGAPCLHSARDNIGGGRGLKGMVDVAKMLLEIACGRLGGSRESIIVIEPLRSHFGSSHFGSRLNP